MSVDCDYAFQPRVESSCALLVATLREPRNALLCESPSLRPSSGFVLSGAENIPLICNHVCISPPAFLACLWSMVAHIPQLQLRSWTFSRGTGFESTGGV